MQHGIIMTSKAPVICMFLKSYYLKMCAVLHSDFDLSNLTLVCKLDICIIEHDAT